MFRCRGRGLHCWVLSSVLFHLLYVCVVCSTAVAVCRPFRSCYCSTLQSEACITIFHDRVMTVASEGLIDIRVWCINCYACVFHDVLLLITVLDCLDTNQELRAEVVVSIMNHAYLPRCNTRVHRWASVIKLNVYSLLLYPDFCCLGGIYVQCMFYGHITFSWSPLYSDVNIQSIVITYFILPKTIMLRIPFVRVRQLVWICWKIN